MNIFLNFNNYNNIFSPISGECISVDNIEDDVFSQKMLGDGVAILPSNGLILAPFDGVLTHVMGTFHAYNLKNKNGIEILIHVGLDTVELKGEGFESFLSNGDSFKLGDKLGFVDLNFLKNKGYNSITAIVITCQSSFKNLELSYGIKEASKDLIMSIN